MAQLIVRDLDDDVKKHLQRRAKNHGHSMEAEVRDILRSAVATLSEPKQPFGTRFAAHFENFGLDESITEIRGQVAKPAKFGE